MFVGMHPGASVSQADSQLITYIRKRLHQGAAYYWSIFLHLFFNRTVILLLKRISNDKANKKRV